MIKNLALLQKLFLCTFSIAISTSAQAQTLNNGLRVEVSKPTINNSHTEQCSAFSTNSNVNNGCYRSKDNKDSFLYTSTDGSYTALFPGKPSEEVVEHPLPQKFISTIVRYGTPDRKYYYTIRTDKYLKKLSKKEIKEIFTFPDEVTYSGTEAFEYKRKFMFNGYETHEYMTYENKWQGAAKTRMFLDRRTSTIYTISVGTGGEGTPSRSLDTPEIESFFNSLKVKKVKT